MLDVTEPITQEIDRGLSDSLNEQSIDNENDKETLTAMKSGNLKKKLESNDPVKTYPKRSTGRERLIRSHSSARFCFELSGNSN